MTETTISNLIEIKPVVFGELEHTHLKWRVEFSKKHGGPVIVVTMVRLEQSKGDHGRDGSQYLRMSLGKSPTLCVTIAVGWHRNKPVELKELKDRTWNQIDQRKGWAWELVRSFAETQRSAVV